MLAFSCNLLINHVACSVLMIAILLATTTMESEMGMECITFQMVTVTMGNM